MGHLTPTAILPGPVDDLHQQAGDAPKITRLDNQDAGVRVFCPVHDQPVAPQVQCCKDSLECPTSNHSVQQLHKSSPDSAAATIISSQKVDDQRQRVNRGKPRIGRRRIGTLAPAIHQWVKDDSGGHAFPFAHDQSVHTVVDIAADVTGMSGLSNAMIYAPDPGGGASGLISGSG